MSPIIITASLLRHHLMCQRRTWLDQHGDPDERQPVTPGLSQSGQQHEDAISANMFGPAQTVAAASWEEARDLTDQWLRQGVRGVRGATLERWLTPTVLVRGRIDWLKRVADRSVLGNWAYEPVEIKRRAEINEADEWQLDLYCWLLEPLLGMTPAAWFWLGRDLEHQPQRIVEHTYRPERLLAAIESASQTLTAADAPPVYLAKHCQQCHWLQSCTEAAQQSGDISSLPGLSQQTWEHLRREGITTLEQFLALESADLLRFKGIGKAKARELNAYARALHNRQPVILNPLPALLRQAGLMFDLETRLDDGAPWCFGWREPDGQTRIAIVDRFYEGTDLLREEQYHVFRVETVDEGWRLVAQAAERWDAPVYHWTGYEVGVLKQSAPPYVIASLAPRLHDLHRSFKQTAVLPLKGTSIKKVAAYFGFRWPPGTDAFTCWYDYQAWLLEGNKDRLARACAYNRADVEAMQVVWEWLQVTALDE